MAQFDSFENAEFVPVGRKIVTRTVALFVFLAAMTGAIVFAGQHYGATIALGGHTESTKTYEIVIGNNVLEVPANMIRFGSSRRNGDASRVDLYMRYPDMTGYAPDAREDFNRTGTGKNIVFATFEIQAMPRDMTNRYDALYSLLLEGEVENGPAGLSIAHFRAGTGYGDDTLVFSDTDGKRRFVARCLPETEADVSLAPCERDVNIGKGLTVFYRFPRELLADWKSLDAAVMSSARSMLKTGA